jgi:hypothetical protein
MDRRVWFSPRALKLHAVILIVVPGFLALCIWQIDRALGGNTLSWAYVFEWPLFAAYAVYMWWRILHETPDTAPDAAAENGHAAAVPAPPDAPQAQEDAELAAYNEYLARLAEQDRAAGR